MEPHCKKEITEQYIGILKKELILSTGCTEPASIALAVSVLRDILGRKPDSIEAELSKNVIKNVSSVTVPHTGGLRGIKTAVATGIAAKGHRDGLNILGSLSADSAEEIKEYLSSVPVTVRCLDSENVFEIDVSGKNGAHTARVRLVGDHLNLVLAESDGADVTASYRQFSDSAGGEEPDYSLLSVKDIFDFAVSVDLSLVESILRPQIVCNSAISRAGLEGDFGASIGKLLYNGGNCSLKDKARAFAAAGSDARMNGCEKPVCIISGSGNQGMTASLPVIAYAEGLGAGDEQLLRALLLSDLLTIHQKTGVGCLSAFCGAICAGGGAGCGICYLLGGGLEEISATLSNCAAMLSGTICDGAKSSCAAKIAMAVEAGITAAEMALRGRSFRSGDGIIADCVEKTIANVGRIANEGMRITDDVIVDVLFDR